jgi:hypothetical protein
VAYFTGSGAPTSIPVAVGDEYKDTQNNVLYRANGTISSNDWEIVERPNPVMVGDSGSGGVAGLVPAPAAGDAAANKYLKASGAWATVSGGVSDHGALTGLADDDHSQYHNDSRAATWLGTKSTTDLAEGTNLYHTAAAARAALSAPQYTRYVDGLYAGGNSDGSVSRPFTTIQAALDTFPEPTTAAESKKRYVVWVHPGAYNEDIVIPAGLHCSILTDGFVSIGEGDLQNHASTTNRSITIEVNTANYFAGTTGGRPQIVIGSINGKMMGTTHPAYATGFHIREIKYSQLGTPAADTVELTLVGCKIGSPGVVSTGTQNSNMSFYDCFCSGPITTTGTGLIYDCVNTEIDGLVTANKINRAWMSAFDGGITVTAADSSTQAPCGFFDCIIGGTFTGPASSYRVNLCTKALGAPTLAGGATEVLLDAVASATSAGAIALAAQTMGSGLKTFADGIAISDAKDLAVGTSTGSKIGTATTQKIGFWNATPIVQPAAANQAALTNSTGGAYDGTLADVTALHDQTILNNNFTDLYTLLTEIRTALVNAGIMKGSA